MTRTRVAQILKDGQPGTLIDVRGWVRTKRESKQDFAFLEINDGSCLKNVQVVVDGKLPDYSSFIKQIHTGASVAVIGEIKESLGKGQRVEVHASSLKVLGTADPTTYPPYDPSVHGGPWLRGSPPRPGCAVSNQAMGFAWG